MYSEASVTAIRYQYGCQQSTVKRTLQELAIPSDLIDDNVLVELTTLMMPTWTVKGFRVLIAEFFRMPSAVLCLHVFHRQPFLKSYKLLYRSNDDYLTMG
ncbi:hypothetical protein TNCV_3114271 [Trichonephila clavipes]|nr:hypothetical protein TNCV_3114271 [Trichonephila clavipes]